MHKIDIKECKGVTKLKLDDLELMNVIEYQLKGSATGTTELTLKLDAILSRAEIE